MAIYRDTKCRKCLRNERIAAGLCTTCNRPTAPDRKQCSTCLNITNQSAKKRARLDRQLALEHYGKSCKFCGESREIFLTIDHIDNNGAEHRRGQKGQNRGHNLPTWLRRNKFPEGFQVLCFNCNCAKGIYGEEAVKKALSQ